MANEATYIKQVYVTADSQNHDIEALHFIADTNLDTPAQWKSYIDSLVNKGTSIKGPYTTLPDISTDQKKKDAYTQYAGDIILISGSDPESGTYVEYVGITGKIGTTDEDNAITAWEKIGTTSTDLSEYAKAGTYKTSGPNVNETGSAGAQTATVSGSITYSKAPTATGEAGGHTINGNSFTFTGTKANLVKPNNGSIKIDNHSIAAHSHTVNVAAVTAGNQETVLKGVKVSATTAAYTSKTNSTTSVLNGITFGTTNVLKGVKVSATTAAYTGNTPSSTAVVNSVTKGNTNVFNSCSVSTLGVLSFGTTSVVNSVTSGTVNVLNGISFGTTAVATNVAGDGTAAAYTSNTPASTNVLKDVTFGTTTVATAVAADGTAAVLKSVPGITTGTAGATTLTHTQANTATTDYKTLDVTVATTTYEYTPAGSIGGSQTVGNHTHSITNANATATFSLSAAVGNHTHSLSSHTHTVTISNAGPSA
jgi:hypothetical protein